MLQERIASDLKKAMIEKDVAKRDLLRVVLSEINRIDKMPDTKKVGDLVSDEEIVKLLKKGIENAKLCNTEFEIPIYQLYLPQEITDEEISGKLIPVFAARGINKSNVGELMKVAKEILGSDFDGKRVSAIIKNL
jgi:uncharacterized protein YqeY